MEELEAVREGWFKAYLSADVKTLQSIELPTFTAISENGIEDASNRYSEITHKKESGNWFRLGAQKVETVVSYISNGSTCQVVGSGKIVANGKAIRQSNFSELWVKSSGLWKVQSIHSSGTK